VRGILPKAVLIGPLAVVVSFFCAPASAAPSVDMRRVQVVGDHATAPGRDGAAVRLTIRPRWQRLAERLLADSRAPEGAIVVSDTRTGKIIAWATRGSGKDFVSAPHAPAASLFKIVTASALLESGRASPSTRQCYAGGEHDVREQDLKSQPARSGACTTLGEALGHSVNMVFAQLAAKHLKPADLRRRAEMLGIGTDVPIDLEVPRSDTQIPEDPFGMARAAAGFGGGRLSALSALAMMQTIANGGERIKLSVLEASPGRVSAGRAMSEKHAASLRQMLEVTTRRGTCAKAFRKSDGSRYLANTQVAAKTGTLITGKPVRMFSWFAGFAPSNKPEIAIAVMLGNDLKWWEKANVVGREFLRAYFEGTHETRRVASRSSPGASR
jgi:penicillin-binding protein A